MNYNFHYRVNLRNPRYLITTITSFLPLSQSTQDTLRKLLAFDTQTNFGYPAGSVESISREEYDKALGWEAIC